MFEVPTQTPIATQPAEGPFDHPAAGQDGKAFGIRRTTHDFHAPPKLFTDLSHNVFIGPIRPDQLEATPAIMHVTFAAGKERLQDELAPRAIGNACAMH